MLHKTALKMNRILAYSALLSHYGGVCCSDWTLRKKYEHGNFVCYVSQLSYLILNYPKASYDKGIKNILSHLTDFSTECLILLVVPTSSKLNYSHATVSKPKVIYRFIL